MRYAQDLRCPRVAAASECRAGDFPLRLRWPRRGEHDLDVGCLKSSTGISVDGPTVLNVPPAGVFRPSEDASVWNTLAKLSQTYCDPAVHSPNAHLRAQYPSASEDSTSDRLALRRASFSFSVSTSFCRESKRSVRLFKSETISALASIARSRRLA